MSLAELEATTIPHFHKDHIESPEVSTALLADKERSDSSRSVIITAKRKGITCAGLLPTIFVIAVSFGLGSTLLLWLITHQAPTLQKGIGDAVRNGSFIVDEGSTRSPDGASASHLRALTFSALASHLISMTSSFLMTLVAYRSAARWLGNSGPGEGRQTHLNPTPLQYGLTADLLATSSIMGIFRSVKYTFRKRNQRAALPPILVEALVIAVVVFLLTHALGLADFWLHSTTRSILAPVQTLLPSDPSGKHGVAFNQTYCDSWVANSAEVLLGLEPNPCFKTTGGDWAETDGRAMTTGWALSHNMTLPGSSFRVVTVNAYNDTAILVPFSPTASPSSPVTPSLSYSFTTTGAQATCKIITSQCAVDGVYRVQDCTQAGYPWLPIGQGPYAPRPNCTDSLCMGSRMFTVIDGSIGHFVNDVRQVFPVNATIPPNPVPLFIQLQFFDTQTTPVYFNNYNVTDNRQTMYASCDLTYLNVTAHYDAENDSYNVTDTTVSPRYLAAVLSGPLTANYASDRLAADIQGTALISDIDTVTALLNQDLGRIAIGWVAGVFDNVPAIQSWSSSDAVLGQYPIGPVFTVVGILYIYTVFAIVIFFSSSNAASYSIDTAALGKEKGQPAVEKRAVVLGQTWLTNSLPFLGYVFEEDSRRSVAEDSLDMIQDRESDRLELGVHDTGNGGTMFGLRKRGTAPERGTTDDGTVETLDV